MKNSVRESIKRFVPKELRYRLKNIYRNLKTFKARKAFDAAVESPEWLDSEMLEYLQDKYSYPPASSYTLQDRKKAADERVAAIFNTIGSEAPKINRFLDLGCSEGLVCAALERCGKFAVGIDLTALFVEGPDRNAAFFSRMDASRLAFTDGSFDFIFSFASFEHFNDPRAVIEECIRIVRPGGYIYLHFGPLYLSHYGLHAYRSITIPYCQCLFDKEALIIFCEKKGLKPPAFDSLNQWTLENFRSLWKAYPSKLRRVRYYEYINTDHVDLITSYPYCFKSKTQYFHNLIVPEIEVLFQKTAC
ncbi:MAG: class I SAM-dependent methyltransferase [Deltaproteobacteria bacterium]|nr:class I SAM-dependent methyltransferase [Deltaproteobacteria bacterium]